MSVFQAIVLGIIQGLTEFLPISSSGHLILIPNILNWEVQSLVFDTVLHLGTALALIIYFFNDLLIVIKEKTLLTLLLVGSIPAALIGYLFEGYVEFVFREPVYVAVFLIFGSLLMLLAEKHYKGIWFTHRKKDIGQITNRKSFIVGIFQALALLPGTSRSGATISGGMLFGLSREMAARFSFLLSIPIVLGAGTFKLVGSYHQLSFDLRLLAGFFSSFFIGMLAINFLLRFLKKNNLYVFIIYRILLAGIILVLFI